MAVSVEMQHTGDSGLQAEVRAIIEHVLADRPGDWRVSIVGFQANDRWERKIVGPNAFERSYTLEGTAGEHEPHFIGKLVARMMPGRGALIENSSNCWWLYWCPGLTLERWQDECRLVEDRFSLFRSFAEA